MTMAQQGQAIASLRSLTLDLPPSCIEFCTSHPDFFVVGTYNLQRDEEAVQEGNAEQDKEDDEAASRQSQNRNGSLLVFRLQGDELQHIQTLLHPSAILDLHFHPQLDKTDVLVVVSSTGSLSFFRLDPFPEDSAKYLTELATHRPLGGEEDVLFLSCCWHPGIADLLAITTSACKVHVLRVDDLWNVYVTDQDASGSATLTHALEAWTAAFSPIVSRGVADSARDEETFTIYSGGDDSMLLQTFGSYQPKADGIDETFQYASPPIRTKGHQAGVTAILPLAVNLDGGASILLTGSYDDHIRAYAAWDTRPNTIIVASRLLAERNLGGGVWRLKLVSLSGQRSRDWTAVVLASCMHAGSRVLKIMGTYSADYGSCEIQILARFEEHKSMNYGSDFQPGTELGGRPLRCVSTSFYDKLLSLWELK
ncbi:hypothetical protein BJ170DRAFT_675889 [Xylariales sp. AK1849]|nr:hypothetical protein BJ170DRAFT_675889 [Xylariales sp. AK1849]